MQMPFCAIMRSWTLLAAFGGSYAPGTIYTHAIALCTIYTHVIALCTVYTHAIGLCTNTSVLHVLYKIHYLWGQHALFKAGWRQTALHCNNMYY